MNKVFVLISVLFVFKTAYSQLFVTQSVKFQNNWKQSLVDKKMSINYVDIRDLDNNVLFVIDSNDFVLIDVNIVDDSLELFYKTSLGKIILKKKKLPLDIITENNDLTHIHKYLKIDPFHKIKYNLTDTLIQNEISQEFLKVYRVNDVELAVSCCSFLRGFRNNQLIWELYKYQSSGMFNICANHAKRHIVDTYGNRVLYLYYNSGGFWRAPKNYLLELDINTGKVFFKSPFKQNVNAFYLKNGNILIVAMNDADNNHVYVYNKKKRKIDYNYFSLKDGILINAILIR